MQLGRANRATFDLLLSALMCGVNDGGERESASAVERLQCLGFLGLHSADQRVATVFHSRCSSGTDQQGEPGEDQLTKSSGFTFTVANTLTYVISSTPPPHKQNMNSHLLRGESWLSLIVQSDGVQLVTTVTAGKS